jgi:hypothetical protein
LEKLNLLTRRNRLHPFYAVFITDVFSGSRCCPSIQSAFSFLLRSVALQLGVFLLQVQFDNMQIL